MLHIKFQASGLRGSEEEFFFNILCVFFYFFGLNL